MRRAARVKPRQIPLCTELQPPSCQDRRSRPFLRFPSPPTRFLIPSPHPRSRHPPRDRTLLRVNPAPEHHCLVARHFFGYRSCRTRLRSCHNGRPGEILVECHHSKQFSWRRNPFGPADNPWGSSLFSRPIGCGSSVHYTTLLPRTTWTTRQTTQGCNVQIYRLPA